MIRVITVFVFMFVIGASCLKIVQIFMVTEFDFGRVKSTVIFVSIAIPSIASLVAAKEIIRRIGAIRATTLAVGLAAIGASLMSMAPLGPLPFIVGLWVLGATSFGKVAYLQYLSSRVDASRMGALQGALGAVSALSSIVGNSLFTTLFVGPLGGHNSWSLFLIGAGILCMACGLIVRSGASTPGR